MGRETCFEIYVDGQIVELPSVGVHTDLPMTDNKKCAYLCGRDRCTDFILSFIQNSWRPFAKENPQLQEFEHSDNEQKRELACPYVIFDFPIEGLSDMFNDPKDMAPKDIAPYGNRCSAQEYDRFFDVIREMAEEDKETVGRILGHRDRAVSAAKHCPTYEEFLKFEADITQTEQDLTEAYNTSALAIFNFLILIKRLVDLDYNEHFYQLRVSCSE